MAENEQGSNPPEDAAQPVEPVAAAPAAAGQGQVSKDARNMALLCHLLAILTGFLGPLILWMIKKDDDPFIDEHGKEALNFQIALLIAWVVGGLLTVVCVGFFILMAAGICDLIFCIIAAVKANNGELYRYPLSIRFIK